MTIFSKNRNKYALICGVILLVALAAGSCNREAIYDNLKDFANKGEPIYPARFDTIFGKIGYERVEIDLRKDGRIPANKMSLGKAKRTVVVWDEDMPEPQKNEYDSVCSWVNITGLTEPRLYRFKVFTEDEHGNRSLPAEIDLIPYTSFDRDVLALGILDPTISAATSVVLLEWPTGLHSIMMEYHGMEYKYTDANNREQKGKLKELPRIFAANLTQGKEVVFDMTYRVLPILGNRQKLLDTISIQKPFVVQMPTAELPFYPSEMITLKGNGINVFTLAEANKITKLTYPMNMTTFADLFYFNNVHTLNLTGKGLPASLETMTYSNNDMLSVFGGGEWQEFMMPMHQPHRIRENTGKAPDGLQTLKDAIESGQITKIQYIPKTLGTEFDRFLEPYMHVVELLQNNHTFFPEEVFISPQFFGNGQIQDHNWIMELAYSGAFLPRPGLGDIGKFNPLNDVVNGKQVTLPLDALIQKDGSNIYRGRVVRGHASIFFALPSQWRFDNQKYRYLKFKVFYGTERAIMDRGKNWVFRQLWIRSMNRLWWYDDSNGYGHEDWGTRGLWTEANEIDRREWKEFTVDMGENNGGDNSNRRNRIYVFCIGAEQDVAGWETFNIPGEQIVVYLADIRLCKYR